METTDNNGGAPVVEASESDGQLVSITVRVFCLGCEQFVDGSHEIDLNAPDFDPELLPTFDIPCPTCTAAKGEPTVIPVIAGVGQHAAEMLAALGIDDDLVDATAPGPPDAA